MQKIHQLQLKCQNCQENLHFSLFELEEKKNQIVCENCRTIYDFNDEKLKSQIDKFEKLCIQIHLSEEILSSATIGVHIGDREIKIPFKILLSRLNSSLDLMVGNKPLTITFRIEPIIDVLKLNKDN